MKIKKYIKHIIITSFFLCILLYLGGCAKTKQHMLDAGNKQLTTQELTSLLSERKTAKVFNTKKSRWYTLTYLADGSVSAVRKGRTRTSIYKIEDNQFCSKRRTSSRKEVCSSWFKIDEQTYNAYTKDGSLVEEITFQ